MYKEIVLAMSKTKYNTYVPRKSFITYTYFKVKLENLRPVARDKLTSFDWKSLNIDHLDQLVINFLLNLEIDFINT